MAKTLTNAALNDKQSRLKLPHGVHWFELDQGKHLGYRKKQVGATWLVRWYVGSGKYQQLPIGTADDVSKADGLAVLSFTQARDAANKAVEAGRQAHKAAVDGKPLTVADVMAEYSVLRDNRTKALNGRADARSGFSANVDNHVKGTPLADTALHLLTVRDLQQWSQGIDCSLAVGTVRRIRNDIKAALNAAAKSYADRLPPNFSVTIKHGLELKGIAPRLTESTDDEFKDIETQVLSDDQVRRVIEAAGEIDDEVRYMVLLLATTGMRLSQIARMRVADVDAANCTLHIPVSRKGKGAEDREGETTSRRVDPAVIELLRPLLSRPRGALLLERRRMVKRGWKWEDAGRGPWLAVDISKPWIAVRNRAELPEHVTSYALRHSSICRMIRQRVPTLMVAKRHNTSVAIIERHYARAINDAFPETAEEVFAM